MRTVRAGGGTKQTPLWKISTKKFLASRNRANQTEVEYDREFSYMYLTSSQRDARSSKNYVQLSLQTNFPPLSAAAVKTIVA